METKIDIVYVSVDKPFPALIAPKKQEKLDASRWENVEKIPRPAARRTRIVSAPQPY